MTNPADPQPGRSQPLADRLSRLSRSGPHDTGSHDPGPHDTGTDSTGGTGTEPKDTMPPLVSIMARHTRMVELLLAVCVLGLVLVLGLFLVVTLNLARANGGVTAQYAWLPSAALFVGLLVGVLGTRWGYRRDRVMMPWALLGAVLWLLPTVWVLVQITR